MNLKFGFLIYLLFSSVGWAAFNETLTIKKVSEDGNQFIFVRKEGPPPWNGITIKDPHTKSMLYEARVTKCNATACVGVVVRNHSGIKLRADEDYLHSYNEKPIQYDPQKAPKIDDVIKPELKPDTHPEKVVTEAKEPEPLPPPPKVETAPPAVVENPEPETEKPRSTGKAPPKPKVVEKKDEAPKPMDKLLYGAYGSPIGPGFKIGYFKIFEAVSVGLQYANISSTTNSVSVKGHLFSAAAVKTLLQPSPSVDINLLGELGLAKATLDFSGVDEDGPTEEESTYFLALGGEARLNLDRLSFSLRSGASKAGFGSDYEGQLNSYNNPYGNVLIFLEVGLYYRF